MRIICRILVIICISMMALPVRQAFSESDMPIVTDQPWTEEELEEARALQQQQLAEAQQRLIDLGYLTGKADGIYGPRTKEALGLFQTLHGLEVTGEPDAETTEKLNADDALALRAKLVSGESGEAVEALQRELIRLGFLYDDADGKYGKKTVAAVRGFQRHLIAQGLGTEVGIEETGEATPVTQLFLFDPDYSSYLMDLIPGLEGDEAARVERKLATLGYMDAEPDGMFDDYAVACAEAFLGEAGLSQTAFDRAFVDALFSEDAPRAQHYLPHDLASGDTGHAVREAREALVRCGMTVELPDDTYGDGMVRALERVHEYLLGSDSSRSSLFADPGILTVEAQEMLREGLPCALDKDDDGNLPEKTVLRLQRRLHTLYYLSKYAVDGIWGDNSREALASFQQSHDLVPTGDPDQGTLDVLFSEDAVSKKYPYRVEVDLDRQRVLVYQLQQSGEYEQIHTFVCSSGLGNTTPRGIYLNGCPVNRWHYFEKFKCWAQYSYAIEGDIMFHSVLYSDRDESTLRQGSVYALGSKASHGCVRLAVKDARWLFENCKRGSLVILIY